MPPELTHHPSPQKPSSSAVDPKGQGRRRAGKTSEHIGDVPRTPPTDSGIRDIFSLHAAPHLSRSVLLLTRSDALCSDRSFLLLGNVQNTLGRFEHHLKALNPSKKSMEICGSKAVSVYKGPGASPSPPKKACRRLFKTVSFLVLSVCTGRSHDLEDRLPLNVWKNKEPSMYIGFIPSQTHLLIQYHGCLHFRSVMCSSFEILADRNRAR